MAKKKGSSKPKAIVKYRKSKPVVKYRTKWKEKKVYRKAKRHGQLKEAFGGYMKVAGRKAIVLVRYLPPKKDYPAHKTEIFIDVQALVPTCVKGYDWDGNITGRYIYKNLKFNVGLAGEQFTPEANGMAEPVGA